MKRWIFLLVLLLSSNAHSADVAFTDGEGIDSITSGGTTFTVSCEEATTANKGCASFASDEFTVTTGAVAISDNAIDDAMIDYGTGTNQVSASDNPNEDLGEMSINSGIWSLDNYVVENVNMADDAFGDFTCSTGTCSLDTNSVSDNEINYTVVTCAKITTSDCNALVSPTLNTGQGANELFDMDQNVLTTSDVNFNSVTSPLTGEVTGNASTATALAANGANCSAGNYPLGVDASGAVESCTADSDTTYLGGTNLTLAGTTFNVDDVFVLTAGDTMTGDLTLSSTLTIDGKIVNGLRTVCSTILEPDKVQAVSDAVPLFAIEATAFPSGIEITQVYLKTSAFGSPAYSVNLEKWATPTDASPDTLTTIALANTTSATEANEAPDTTSTVGTSEIIKADLPTNNVNWVEVCVEFYGL